MQEHLDRVVDAGHEQHPLRDEPELRALLRRDQQELPVIIPIPKERDRRDDEDDERGDEVRVVELEAEERRDDDEQGRADRP